MTINEAIEIIDLLVEEFPEFGQKEAWQTLKDAIALLDEADTILSAINPDCQWRSNYKQFLKDKENEN